jgi:hypothetical protein
VTARDPITPIPNELLSQLRRYIEQSDLEPACGPPSPGAQYARRSAAVRASELLAHLDAGGRLPDAWTPYAPADRPSVAGAPFQSADEPGGLTRNPIGDDDQVAEVDGSTLAQIRYLSDALHLLREDTEDALQAVERLTTDRDSLHERLARAATERDNALRQYRDADRALTEARDEIDGLRAEIAAGPSIASDLAHRRTALAEIVETAARIADHAAGGTARDVKISADHALKRGQPADRAQLAAMIAVGAARYGSHRKSDDLAHRTANHLYTLADQLRTPPAP